MKKVLHSLSLICFTFTLQAALLVEDGETGTTSNSIGGVWATYNDGYSVLTIKADGSPAYEGNYCKQLNWTINEGSSSPYAGATTSMNGGWTGIDLSAYYGVRFYARGNGSYEVNIGTDQTRAENNHYSKEITVTPEWRLYELPFVLFTQKWGTPGPWDPSTIFSIGFSVVASPDTSGQIFIDNIEFYYKEEGKDPNIIIPLPKINQEGYLTQGRKYFCITTNVASQGDPFYVRDSLNNVVFSGTITGSPVIDTSSTGEEVWKVDFSAFSSPGTYTISVNDKESHPFAISDSVFNSLFRDALRCFYLIRCGLAEDDPITGINRPACHLSDAMIRGGFGIIDVTGGWHNACDLGKFVHEIAVSVAYMLWLYELKSGPMMKLNIHIPESGNQVSDLLNEARWGLTWLLKMQKSDSSVYHKVDSEPDLGGFFTPDMDPYERYVEFQKATEPQVPSTIDAAVFAGVMAQSARVFKAIDDNFSATCLDAAKKAWAWLITHPETGQSDPYYIDPDWSQEYIWALGEMARTLNSNTLRTQFSATIDTVNLIPFSQDAPHMFGYIALYFDDQTSLTLKNKIKSKILSLCNSIVSTSNNTGYGVALDWWEYWWESNEWLMDKANCLLIGYEITGDTIYRDAAIAQLNYMLGINSLDKSFVMEHGTNSMKHPYNWIYIDYGKSIPGWTAGGANCYTVEGYDVLLADLIKIGTPRAKCYLDTAVCGYGSWASNEAETSENASLVFLSGYFYKTDYIEPVSTGTIKSVDKIDSYPTPCNLNCGCAGINFTGLPLNSELVIYNILGNIVYSISKVPAEGILFWNMKSKDNITLQPGVYLYSVSTSEGLLKTGKLEIIK